MGEQNKALVRRFLEEVVNRGDTSRLEEFFTANPVDHTPFPGQPPGVEGIRQALNMIRAAFPDMRVTIEDMIAEGDRVVVRSTITGTHRGDFMGLPPTGKRVSVMAIDITRVEGGKQAEHWGLFDRAELMDQVGEIPRSARPENNPPSAFPS